MSPDERLRRAAGLGAAVTLAAIGGTHLAWGAGSSWPARTRADLADAVVGSPQVPGPIPCAVVGSGLIALAALSLQRTGLGQAARVAGTAGLLGRGIVGGVTSARMLRLPSPSERFRRLDARLYRPLCVAAGLALAVGAPSGSRGSRA
ncbi:conserved hypothetical protein [Beutenbergia cavernae DSM 12333]|uniref:DUF3995 domain-containing protein n=1 Tax=Beutenbergia cavernae (strain ATCC BAA-8 / DSM 12333 / CCUG 43141 / JCM 11478 / NBRC 16432 / NCIMB 13614 / HKI 0122) TaxID=471853 RepID=C5BVK7_BEUC1|nr:DUF3995 domain-containing protein [Beutenbergia cavernae]ACQ78447.1 conserved hypothetical protein [Beutenbergia cavernae DSM 12333]